MRRTLPLLSSLAVVAALLALRRPAPPACDPDNAGLVLPPGYCATLFASVPGVRNVAVAPNGDVFAAGGRGTGVTALRDRTGAGHADTTLNFGGGTGTGIAIGPDAIYFAPNDRVIRFAWTPGSLTPRDQGTVVVSGLPASGNHVAKTLALANDWIFVDHGSASNTCQEADRAPKSPGKQPCPELPVRAGTWRYDTRKANQTPQDGERWTTGVRNGMAIAVNPSTGVLWGATHGRDQLSDWGMSPEDNAEKPAEEFGVFAKGADYGWPYCYYDPIAKRKVLAPEYGGDGVKPGDCVAKTQPVIAFPGHWAPMSLAFVPSARFGAAYAGGAFLAFHGSWNRAPLPQAGYRVVFISFKNGRATGQYRTFATGSGGATSLRASGVAMAPDGSVLFIASDGAGKIWRVIPTTPR
ncbi:MAG: PQQ-dependent sugar dehydrogenase [Gemmatimonadales bacterium]